MHKYTRPFSLIVQRYRRASESRQERSPYFLRLFTFLQSIAAYFDDARHFLWIKSGQFCGVVDNYPISVENAMRPDEAAAQKVR